jgi:hypothetical protein
MDSEFDIPWIEDSKHHAKWLRLTMGRGFEIPWVGGSIYHE